MVIFWIKKRRCYQEVTPREKFELEVTHISLKMDVSCQLKTQA